MYIEEARIYQPYQYVRTLSLLQKSATCGIYYLLASFGNFKIPRPASSMWLIGLSSWRRHLRLDTAMSAPRELSSPFH
jgi:hypothetical protein